MHRFIHCLMAWSITLLVARECWARAGRLPIRFTGGGGRRGGGFVFLFSGGEWLLILCVVVGLLIVCGAIALGWAIGATLGDWTRSSVGGFFSRLSLSTAPSFTGGAGWTSSSESRFPLVAPPVSVPPSSSQFLSAAEVAGKEEQTIQLLEALALHDPLFTPTELTAIVTTTFLELQRCWQARNYDPVRPLLMPGLLAEHLDQLWAMRRNREVNRVEDVQILRLEFVHVFCPEAIDGQEFTALITAQAKDYLISEASGALLGGDRSTRVFQEFWTFRRQEKSWRLQAIEQCYVLHRLYSPNYVAGRGDPEGNPLSG